MSARIAGVEWVFFISGILLSIVGLVAVGAAFAYGVVAIGLGFAVITGGYAVRTDRLLSEVRASQFDEKIAVVLGYADYASRLPQADNSNMVYLKDKIITDLIATARIKDSASIEQAVELTRAVSALVQELTAHNHPRDAQDIDSTFRTLL